MGPFEEMMHRLADRQEQLGPINAAQWCEAREVAYEDLEIPLRGLGAAIKLGVMQVDTVLAMAVEIGYEVARERYERSPLDG